MGTTDIQQVDSPEHGDQPGKTRTWWHPLLAQMLDFALSSAYTVDKEVPVGKMPLRVDILLVRREGGELPEAKRRELSALLPLLNRFTLIEFKGPTDVLERGDFAQLLGCSYLWHSQQSGSVPHAEVSLVVLAPMVNAPLDDELRLLGFHASQHEPGIFRVSGLPFTTWLVETDVMAERGQPILSLVSRVFLNNRRRIIDELDGAGHRALLHYMLQQVQQFDSLGKDFAMQHAFSEDLQEVEEDLLTKILEAVPVERRLRGLPLGEVLHALPQEELVAALGAEEAARLRELLDRKQAR